MWFRNFGGPLLLLGFEHLVPLYTTFWVLSLPTAQKEVHHRDDTLALVPGGANPSDATGFREGFFSYLCRDGAGDWTWKLSVCRACAPPLSYNPFPEPGMNVSKASCAQIGLYILAMMDEGNSTGYFLPVTYRSHDSPLLSFMSPPSVHEWWLQSYRCPKILTRQGIKSWHA